MVKLSLPAVKQVLYLTGVVTPREEAELTDRIEKSAKRLLKKFKTLKCIYFVRYDHSGKGELTIKEWFNVVKIQNKVDISLEKVETFFWLFFVIHI